jgi:hypothetical protein
MRKYIPKKAAIAKIPVIVEVMVTDQPKTPNAWLPKKRLQELAVTFVSDLLREAAKAPPVFAEGDSIVSIQLQKVKGRKGSYRIVLDG